MVSVANGKTRKNSGKDLGEGELEGHGGRGTCCTMIVKKPKGEGKGEKERKRGKTQNP